MVIAVVTVGVVEVSVDKVVDVVPMRNGWMPAARAMDVIRIVAGTAVLRGAGRRVGYVDVDAVLIDMVSVRMVQVTIVKVVNMIVVLDGQMATVWSVFVGVVLVNGARHQYLRLFSYQ